MQRDMDLIRGLMLFFEQCEGEAEELIPIAFDDPRMAELGEPFAIETHVRMIVDAGFIIGGNRGFPDGRYHFGFSMVTWNGHEFLDAVRERGVWEEAKSTMKKAGGGGISIAIAIATAIIKDRATKYVGGLLD